LLTADPGGTTLYLDDEELSLSGGAVSGTRYYGVGDATVATLTSGTGVSYLVGDQQGTRTVAISAASLTVTRRYYDPYGNPVGTAASSFPAGEKGFVGGIDDTATGLTDLGVRELQPATGSFISTDPLLTPYDPQDLNAYAYASDNPTTESDPTGAIGENCSKYRLGTGAWLACERLTHPKSMFYNNYSTTVANLERDYFKACLNQPGMGDGANSQYICNMEADNWAHELVLKWAPRPGGNGCNLKAIVSYALTGGYLVGEAQDGVALTMAEIEGIVAATAEAVVSGVLGGVFAIGLAVVIVASC
jgi:RHS repeat-associated protein